MPGWVGEAFSEFAKRMPRETPLSIQEIKAEPRTTGKNIEALLAAEAVRIRSVLPPRCHLVALDERGADLTTMQLAERLRQWMTLGEDVVLVIGGPDGLAAEIKSAAAETLRLSSLTLPHALVRVILAEALYRAASLLKNHPYHRS
jgi:23S rRNA (pseudouridine1915-N3)-methyltransferase